MKPAVAIRVWDLPLRLFHWALVICVVGAFVTIQVGGNWVEWHFRFGYATLALIVFRILWGLFGDRYSRFSSFLYGPARILAYLRGGAAVAGAASPPATGARAAAGEPDSPGHNPLGSLSVFAMIAFLLVQPTLGLFSNDDIASEGPLARFVSKEFSDLLTGLHHRGELVLFLLVGLHLAAIAWYALFRRKNLVRPMITGDKLADAGRAGAPVATNAGAPASLAARDDAGVRLRAVVLFALSAAAIWFLVTL
ncbi:MAG: cytochrome b/b6 domain-containing protein [Lautropia sp.]